MPLSDGSFSFVDTVQYDRKSPWSQKQIDDFAIPDEQYPEQEQSFSLTDDEDTANPTVPGLTKEEVIDQILLEGGNTVGNKKRIYDFFTSTKSMAEKANYLKHEYGIAGRSTPLENGGHNSWGSDARGLRIEYKDSNIQFIETLTWSRAAALTDILINRGLFYNPPEMSAEIIDEDDEESFEDHDTNAAQYEQSTDDSLSDEEYIDLALASFKKEEETPALPKPDPILEVDPQTQQQLSLLDLFPLVPDTYELDDNEDGGHVITGSSLEDSNEPSTDLITDSGKNADEERTQAAQDVKNSDKPAANDVPDPGTSIGMNYRYSPDHHLYEGGAKTKCRANIAAIKLLKKLEEQQRIATAEEKQVLAKFVGWGGLAAALTPNKAGWEKEYEEIKTLLTDAEFESAVESTTTAYYTKQGIINYIYQALEQFGFQEGNILDPAMGTGNFFSVLPDSMRKSRLYGVELDSITGRIAKQLYPEATIQIKGYEETEYPDNFFDIAIGNIPFNSLKVSDKRYDKYNFLIHDYFIAKTLDKVRSGGLIAFITTKGTLDKANPTTRKYIAQRAELIGAIRLPNNAFIAVAGTDVTADILFLKKREKEIVPDKDDQTWISVEQTENGIPINNYFIDHPEMLLGEMVFDESMYGNDRTTACIPREGDNLELLLQKAIFALQAEYQEPASEHVEEKETELLDSIPADPHVKNFTYTIINDELYFRENSRMYRQNITGRKAERIKGLIEIRSALRNLMDFQTDPTNSEELPTEVYQSKLQDLLNNLNHEYDHFVRKHGYINSLGNVIAFSKDADAPLLRSIEEENDDHSYSKTAVFYKATIKPRVMPKVSQSAEEALKMSLNMKGRIDLDYMEWLYKHSKDEIIEELGDRIYQNPDKYTGNPHTAWETAGEYLSGYVKDKLFEAMMKAEEEPERFSRNVEALKKVQPEPLTADQISFRLGSTWIPTEYIQDFMYEKFKTSSYNKTGRNAITVEFSEYSGAYHVTGKSMESDSVAVNQTYGTGRKNAYEILEDTLNLKAVEVKDPVTYYDQQGEERITYVLNKKETILAREKQAQIKREFESWLFADSERGARLVKLYNDRFNNIRPRQYNGDDLILPDMSSSIALRKHQRDVIAHGIYGNGNLLIAHEVGAGKTFSGIAIAYELKRLGVINKPLFAVPNHLVGQWSNEYLRLYPNADILVAGKSDLEKKNRRRFASRIATGDYDAIIMAHSSFELINLSRERQLAALKDELEAITNAIAEEKDRQNKDWSLKQMTIFKKNLQWRYDSLFNAEKKDNVVTYEELGVDMLLVDEAHAYKNNFTYTKMRNVAGIGRSSSQRAMDMYLKCQYVNQINDGKGVCFLTGTPVSNSMSELFVMQRYLQPQELKKRGLLMFDSWASTFGEVVSSLEITPEGNGYQMKSRFARFHNLPELMNMFSLVADIKTADMLDLPVPRLYGDAPHVIRTKITPYQKQKMDEFMQRAEAIRAGAVDSTEDNFLKLTSEARLNAVDPRILDEDAPFDPDTKLNACIRNVARIYSETSDLKLTQIVFCDTGTPKNSASFDFYNAVRDGLINEGISKSDMVFIHEAKTDVQREELFEKVRKGQVRILMGSTAKMGVGMNVQDILVAVHHLDVPWRPSDLTQRNGRALRQGNTNEEIYIYNYITESTFDAYLWQIIEQKQRYISQIMTGRSHLRSCEDMDTAVLQYAEFKALAISDPRIKEKMEIDNEISKLQILKSSWKAQQSSLQSDIFHHYPNKIANLENAIKKHMEDMQTFTQNKPAEFSILIGGKVYEERVKAGEHLRILSNKLGHSLGESLDVGSYAGFNLSIVRQFSGHIDLHIKGKSTYQTTLGDSDLGNITRLENLAESIERIKTRDERELENAQKQLAEAKLEAQKPFEHEEKLAELLKRQVELNMALEFKDLPDDDLIDGNDEDKQEDENEDEPEKGTRKETSTMRSTIAERNYDKLVRLAGRLVEGNRCYLKFKSVGFEDLVVEKISRNEISIAHL